MTKEICRVCGIMAETIYYIDGPWCEECDEKYLLLDGRLFDIEKDCYIS